MFSQAALTLWTFAMAAPVPKEEEPEWMGAIRQKYELKYGEYVKRVAKPWVKERIDFHLRAYGTHNKNEDVEKISRDDFIKYENWMTLFIEQDGRKLSQRYCVSHVGLSMKPQQQRGENLFEVSQAVENITSLSAPEFIVDA